MGAQRRKASLHYSRGTISRDPTASDTTNRIFSTKPKSLLDLPTEILQAIASLLEVEFRACLTLVCKAALSIIQNPFQELKLARCCLPVEDCLRFERRLAFLKLLGKDLAFKHDPPEAWLYCISCDNIHPASTFSISMQRECDEWRTCITI